MNCPITGNPCANQKKVSFYQSVGGKVTQGIVCSDCPCLKFSIGSLADFIDPPESGKTFPLPMIQEQSLKTPSVFDIFKQLFGSTLKEKTDDTEIVCVGCNSSLRDLRKSGWIGCGKCYETFSSFLTPTVVHAQVGATSHLGKKPKRGHLHYSLDDLKEKLREAVKSEKYEDAVVLRDAIKRLEEHLKIKADKHQPDQTPKNSDS